MLNICRALVSRPSKEPSSAHWCPAELVQYGWGHYTQPPLVILAANKVQPAPLEQPESQHEAQSSAEERQDGAETPESTEKQEAEKIDESLDPEMMVTLCESPHRFLATLDDDLSLDLPSVPM